MKFVDEAQVEVHAGNGGAGCVAFLREKYRPKGGPAGGNGGDGGSVIVRADQALSTLQDFKFQPIQRAANGEPGRGKEQHGKAGEDRVIRVPVGTQVFDADSDELLADLTEDGAETIIAQGGRGGRGNATFKSSTNQAPRYAQPGIPGEERRIRFELRLLADVGLVGFPNVGKSTFISRISAARPRVADFPFTTLVPNLGVVRISEEESLVVADIPGLIEGAHDGHGLGDRFLRHISRTAILVHLLDAGGLSGRSPLEDFAVINRELKHFDPELADKPQIVVANKIDLLADRESLDELDATFAKRGIRLLRMSGVTGEGVAGVVSAMATALSDARASSAGDDDERERYRDRL
jgi:GTP-binding protein